MEWTRATPTEAGSYLAQGQDGVMYIESVNRVSGELRCCGGWYRPDQIERWWFGPIPDPPQVTAGRGDGN